MTSSASAHHTLVERIIEEIWNASDSDRANAVADELFAPTYVNHGGLIMDLIHGPEAIKTSVALFRLAFPNLHITIVALIVTGHDSMAHWHASNHRAWQLNGLSCGFSGTTRTREADGQIQESWTEWNRETAWSHLALCPETVHHDVGMPEATSSHGSWTA